jgi:nicotinamidase-related amidase
MIEISKECKLRNLDMVEAKFSEALLVVDIQNDFTGQQARMPVDPLQADEMIENINKLIEHAQQLKLLVIYIVNEYTLFDPLNIFRNFAAIQGSEGAKLDSRLIVSNQNYFPKKAGDAFSNPELTSFLKRKGISEVLVAGVYAEACILQTTKGALRNGFSVKVVADAIGTKSQEKRQRCLDEYRKMGIEVAETDKFIC